MRFALLGFLFSGALDPFSVWAQIPAGAVDRALATQAWEQSSSANFELYVRPGAADEIARDELTNRLEAALTHNVRLLGIEYQPSPIRALIVSSRGEMSEIVGGPAGGVAFVDDHAVAFIAAGGRGPIRHELMHLISVEAWGMPAEPVAWASEGLGTLAPGTCAGHTIRALGSLMLSSGELPSIRSLIDDFSFASIHSYLASAGLVEFIAVKYGTPTFQVYWSNGFPAGLARSGRTLEALEEEWHQFLSLAEAAPQSAWEEIRREGCE
jgi:hypothetical protein